MAQLINSSYFAKEKDLQLIVADNQIIKMNTTLKVIKNLINFPDKT